MSRVIVFRAFIRYLKEEAHRSPPRVSSTSIEPTNSPDQLLSAISQKPRQAFLLIYLENLTREEVQRILEISDEELSLLLQTACSEIAQLQQASI